MVVVLESDERKRVITYSASTFEVLAILKYGRLSWKPWLLSLAIELISQATVRQAFEPADGGRTKMTPLEREEYARRMKLLWFNLLRGAFYIHITRFVSVSND